MRLSASTPILGVKTISGCCSKTSEEIRSSDFFKILWSGVDDFNAHKRGDYGSCFIG